MVEVSIRDMEIDDIKYVMAVDEKCFTNPWTEDIFHLEITKNEHAYYFIMELQGMIVGYAGIWVVDNDAQITNIAVLPKFRGCKLGEKLFGFMYYKAIQLGAIRLSLEVRVSNLIAQKMYRKFGLVPGGVKEHYYTDNHEDAIIMWVNL